MSVISVTGEADVGGSWFEANLGKKWGKIGLRSYLKNIL
jgi:hypothetical protein